MANKRDLKRSVNYICGDLLAEAVAASLYNDKNDDRKDEEANNLFAAIIIMRNDFVSRISHQEPGMKAKVYFKKLATDFNAQASDIIDKISNLG